ncbi:ribonuclease [Elizabethkingia miricola]|uniref:Ribonuclease n=1 Tax=Elizabethkingia miricola TaxID=172045 RepID=A0ABD5B2W3_ELIMR|nr:ribonuclease domain-containing protein [Elizabethkingia miricola]MDQ8748235.1 ribonuclease domain-containing protein [Elizabethkingia miricola]OPB87966.1 ribonuclease [Elizabethkingia miricola]
MKAKFLFIAILAIFTIFTGCSNDDSRADSNASTLALSAEAKAQIAAASDIYQLTNEDVVVDYVKKNKKLPNYYVTKSAAQKAGWVASKGNLCTVLPGKAIGGDVFGNREGLLPKKTNRTYYEADLNYNCRNRNADRLIMSNDGLVYVTKDHYQTFTQK